MSVKKSTLKMPTMKTDLLDSFFLLTKLIQSNNI